MTAEPLTEATPLTDKEMARFLEIISAARVQPTHEFTQRIMATIAADRKRIAALEKAVQSVYVCSNTSIVDFLLGPPGCLQASPARPVLFQAATSASEVL